MGKSKVSRSKVKSRAAKINQRVHDENPKSAARLLTFDLQLIDFNKPPAFVFHDGDGLIFIGFGVIEARQYVIIGIGFKRVPIGWAYAIFGELPPEKQQHIVALPRKNRRNNILAVGKYVQNRWLIAGSHP